MAQITNAILLLSCCYLLSSAAGLQFKVGFTPDPDLAYNHRPAQILIYYTQLHATRHTGCSIGGVM